MMLSHEVFPLCPRHARLTRRNSGHRWSTWSAPAATHRIWPERLNRPPQAIRHWVAEADRRDGRREPKPAAALTSTERDELGRLRRENKPLRLARDSLSRAAAWFARETGVVPPGSMP